MKSEKDLESVGSPGGPESGLLSSSESALIAATDTLLAPPGSGRELYFTPEEPV